MSCRILIVDDSSTVRNVHRYILQSAGYEVEDAANGFEALELLYSDSFDLVITDINMPRMDGYTLIRKIRQDDAFKDIPIMIISTESEAEDKRKGFSAGANVYVIKPAKPEEILLNVRMLLGE